MQESITPATRISGKIRLPGDKSISHRYAMLASIAKGNSRIRNYSTGADCRSTLDCLHSLGVKVEMADGDLLVEGHGLDGLVAPSSELNAGNSGSTIRMLSGILAGQPFKCSIAGDESLSRRPMQRIMIPLGQMGATISAHEGKFPPLEIQGGNLRPIDYALPVASAQVKTCVLFAGLYAAGRTSVHEPVATRNHTEIALREFGAVVEVEGDTVAVQGRPRLKALDLRTPSDLSSAAFFIVAALLVPGSELLIQGVGLNPTRAPLLDFLVSMGADIRVQNVSLRHGEPAGDILIKHSAIRGGLIAKQLTAALIDEIPVLSVLGAASEDGVCVRDAAELRVKETDRIATVADNLGRMGVRVEVFDDGLFVPGKQRFRAAQLDSFGDHRIAMACAVAALRAEGQCVIRDAEAARVSFPEFFDTLASLAG
jgi:3-phosphoshikimate 1-carboxyvinyltransferase